MLCSASGRTQELTPYSLSLPVPSAAFRNYVISLFIRNWLWIDHDLIMCITSHTNGNILWCQYPALCLHVSASPPSLGTPLEPHHSHVKNSPGCHVHVAHRSLATGSILVSSCWCLFKCWLKKKKKRKASESVFRQGQAKEKKAWWDGS